MFTDLSRNWQQASLTSRTSRRFAAERRFWTLCLVILIEPVYANSSRFLTKLRLDILIEPVLSKLCLVILIIEHVYTNSSRFLTKLVLDILIEPVYANYSRFLKKLCLVIPIEPVLTKLCLVVLFVEPVCTQTLAGS